MTTIRKISLFLSSLILFTATSAFSAPYVGMDAGAFGYGKNNNTAKNIFDNDKGLGLAGRVNAGYLWNANDCVAFGVEAGANGFNDQEKNHIKKSRVSYDALAVADYHVTSDFDVFAKAGPAYAEEDEKNKLTGVKTNRHSIVPKAAIGAGYDLTENVNLNVSLNQEFQRKDLESVSTVMAGLKYNF